MNTTEECIERAIALRRENVAKGCSDNPKLLWDCIARAFGQDWQAVRDDHSPRMCAIKARVLQAVHPPVLVEV